MNRLLLGACFLFAAPFTFGCGGTTATSTSEASSSSTGSSGSGQIIGGTTARGLTTTAGATHGSTTSSSATSSGTTGGAGNSATSSTSTSTTSGTGAGSTTASQTTSAGTAGSTGSTSNICSTQRCVVYASADHDLYQVDPSTLAQTHLSTFSGDLSSSDIVTDIAVQRDGTVYGITEHALYTIDPTSGTATSVATLSTGSTRWVGLTFTATGTLIAADQNGNVATIDPGTGVVTAAGSFGNYGCSGDILAIDDANQTIYATATDPTCTGNNCDDLLVSLDPVTYAATVVGNTTYYAIYGLGYWAGTLYGFTHGGITITIDPTTGVGTYFSNTSPNVLFSGGATTPLAPIRQ